MRSPRGGPVETASLTELREDPRRSVYAGPVAEHAPLRNPIGDVRGALEGLGDWVWVHAEAHPTAAAYAERWKLTLAWGFPRSDYATTTTSPADD